MPNPTIAAGYPKAFLEFAVSRGADRATLLERSHLCLDNLENPEGRCPLTSYIALMKVGIELCNEPALSLLFGEAVRLQDISIVGFLGETLSDVESGPAMMIPSFFAKSFHFSTSVTPVRFEPCSMMISGAGALTVDGT